MTIDDRYQEVLASIRSRFEALTSDAADPPRLFTTDVTQLYQLYLDALPSELRQICTCSACRKFTERHGGLVRVETSGKATPLLWDPDKAPPLYKGAISALAEAVAKAPITGVFLSSERVWGSPRTGEWEHFAVTPPEGLVHTPSLVKSLSQVMAEKGRTTRRSCAVSKPSRASWSRKRKRSCRASRSIARRPVWASRSGSSPSTKSGRAPGTRGRGTT